MAFKEILIISHSPLENIYRFFGVFLLAVYIFSHAYTFPDIISNVLSILWMFYVPYGLGNIVISIITRYTASSIIPNLAFPTITLMRWFIGIFLVIGSLLVIGLIRANPQDALVPSLLLICVTANWAIPVRASRLNERYVVILVVGLIIGLTLGLYVRSYSPYPLTPGLDTFTHIYTAKLINNGTISGLPLVYFPTVDSLIGLSTKSFGGDILGVFWVGPIFLFILFAISIFSLSYRLLKNYWVSCLCAIISLIITEQGKVANLQFFYPASFVMAIFPLVFLSVVSISGSSRNYSRLGIIAPLFVLFGGLVLLHTQLGIVASSILILYLLLHRLVSISRFALFCLRIATIAISIIVLLLLYGLSSLQLQLPIHIFYKNTASFDNQNIKIKDLTEWYGKEIMTIAIIGLLAISQFKDKVIVVIGFLGAFLLYIYFQQFDIVLRMMTLERFFISFSASVVLVFPFIIVNMITKIKERGGILQRPLSQLLEVGYLSVPQQLGKTKLKFLYVILLTLVISPLLVKPYEIYLAPYLKEGYAFSNFTPYEALSGKWIERNTPKDHSIYSDPFTVLEMRGLGFRKNIEQIASNNTVANNVKMALTSNSSSDMYERILSQVGSKVLIVITPRTSLWLSYPGGITEDTPSDRYYVMQPTSKFVDYPEFHFLFDKKYFKILYHDNDISIFEPLTKSLGTIH
jgi:hypothetical protein